MELSGWDAVALCAKAVTYAATLGAAGAIFFLGYNGPLLKESQRGRIRRLIGILVVASAIAGCARILLLAGSMSGDLAGMFDASLARMILNGGEGRATGLRLAGLALCALCIVHKSPRAELRAHRARSLHQRPLPGSDTSMHCPAWRPSLLLSLHLLAASFSAGVRCCRCSSSRATAPESKIAAVAATLRRSWRSRWLHCCSPPARACSGLDQRRVRCFWSSADGEMMAIKLLAVALMLSMAAANKLYSYSAAADARAQGDEPIAPLDSRRGDSPCSAILLITPPRASPRSRDRRTRLARTTRTRSENPHKHFPGAPPMQAATSNAGTDQRGGQGRFRDIALHLAAP